MADEWKTKGNAALSAGNPKEAIDCYTKAIEINPSDHVFYSNRSAAYLSLNDHENALKDAEECINRKSDWAKGYARKGAALHAQRQYDDAIAAFEKGLEFEPTNGACLTGKDEVVKAKSAATNNPFASAFGPDMFAKIATNPRISSYLSDPSFLQKMQEIQTDPSKISAHLQDPRVMNVFGELMGLNLSTTGDPSYTPPTSQSAPPQSNGNTTNATSEPEPMEDDLTEEEIAVKQKRKKADEAKNRGNALYKEKKFTEAIDCYNEAIEIDSANLSYYTNRAAVYLELKDFDACINDCKKAIEVGRENRADYALIAKAYVRIGNAHLKKGETDENLEAAIDAYECAQMENRTKEIDKKIKLLHQKLKKAKELAYIDVEKGLIAKNEGNEFFKGGDFPKAVERYSEAIRRDPTNAVYYANRGAAYTKLTSFLEAKRDCEKAIELDPNYVKAYSRMGAIQFFMKEYHKARETYMKGLEIDPNSQECKDGLQNVIMNINSGGSDAEREAHGLADPEIRSILSDPVMQNVLGDFQTDPQSAQRHLQNPDIMAKIEKLMAAGVLRTK